jgi:DNA-binding NarL/FixJ family response regulator
VVKDKILPAIEAVDLAEQVQADVVVTDLRMPATDGISALEAGMTNEVRISHGSGEVA